MGPMSEGHTKGPIETYTSHSNRVTRGRLSPYPLTRIRIRGVSEGSDARGSKPLSFRTHEGHSSIDLNVVSLKSMTLIRICD